MTSNGEPAHPEDWNAGYAAGLDDGEYRCAARVATLTAQLREVDARYLALLQAVADGIAMQPKTVLLELGPNDSVEPGRKASARTRG
jgi:hypothetical protein